MLKKILEEIDAYIEECVYDPDSYYALGLKKAKEIIREHMKDDWIPVEKRLPGKSGYYRATVRNVETGDITEETAWFAYNVNEPEWRELYGYEVIAWRNLAPYHPEKGESHD